MTDQDSSIRYIDISTPKHPNTFAIVDAEDFERLNQFKWHVSDFGKAVRVHYYKENGVRKKTKIHLHHEVMRCHHKEMLYFINWNFLDARKENITRLVPIKPKPPVASVYCPDGGMLIDVSTPSHPNQYAIVDADMYQYLSQWRWGVNNQGYVVRMPRKEGNLPQKKLLMHRIIIEVKDGVGVDHIDGNRANNMRSNLRQADQSQNLRNMLGRSVAGYKGVTASRCRNKYIARIVIGYKTVRLGRFDTPEEAHAAYCEAAKKYHGEFANTGHRSESKSRQRPSVMLI